MPLGRFKVQKPYGYRKETSKQHNSEYPYCRKIYRINSLDDIKSLLNEEYVKTGTRYYGKILEVPVRINFNTTSSCSLCAKNEEELEKAYKEVIRILT